MDITPRLSRPSQAPTLLSAAALVISVVALANSVSPSDRGQGLVRELPAEKRLSASRQYVALEQLAIYQDQIADAAVGTLELADGAVTSTKLADEAVTVDKISMSGLVTELKRQLGGANGLLVGEADAEGRVVRGSGFAVTRIATGEYTITFDTQFSGPPIVLTAAQSYGKCYLQSQFTTAGTVRVKCMSDLLGSSPVAANTRFSFIAHAGA